MAFNNIFSKNQLREEEKPVIISDIHEKNSLVSSELVDLGINVQFQPLKVADYLIENTAVERKTIRDFLNSMLNKRLLWQLEELRQYKKKLLIIEGIEEHELYNDSQEGISGNAIRGMLLYISLEENCPIIFSKDYKDTAKFLALIAKRQKKSKKEPSLYPKKKAFDREEQKQFILESFPGIGPSTAKKLLNRFKTINNIINASAEELKEILKSKTESFKKILND